MRVRITEAMITKATITHQNLIPLRELKRVRTMEVTIMEVTIMHQNLLPLPQVKRVRIPGAMTTGAMITEAMEVTTVSGLISVLQKNEWKKGEATSLLYKFKLNE